MVESSTFKNHKFWLLAIATGLVTLHVTLTWRSDDASLLGNSILYWLAIATLVSHKRDTLKLESSIWSAFWALILIILMLTKSSSIIGYDTFLRLSPLLSALALGLLASGFNGLKQYWREFFVLCFLIPSPGALSHLIDISELTAAFSTSLLWYTGFDVYRQGVNILLSGGGIEVYPGCSGIENILHLGGLATVFLMTFPTDRANYVLVPTVATCIAYLVNGVRVAIMAALAASSDSNMFDYWHKGDGSLIFSTISVLLFGCFCLVILRQSDWDEEEPDSENYN
jgi:cyanoexosortase A